VRGGDVRAKIEKREKRKSSLESESKTSFARRRRLGRRGRAPVRGHAPARGALSAPGREAKGAKGAKGVRLKLRVVRLERVVRLGLERGDGRFRVRRVLGRGLARREEAVANIVRLISKRKRTPRRLFFFMVV
jgi:hypothetical protein